MVSHVDQSHCRYLSVLLMRLLVSFMLLTFSSLATSEEMAEETSDEAHHAAIEIVEQLHTNLLEVMQAGDSLSFAERYGKLEPTITASFDTPIIAKVILSRYWLMKAIPLHLRECWQRLNGLTMARVVTLNAPIAWYIVASKPRPSTIHSDIH